MLPVAMLATQGLKFHVHYLDHSHSSSDPQHHSHDIDPALLEDSISHKHISHAHLSNDSSHADQHTDFSFESNVSAEYLLGKLLSKLSFNALLCSPLCLHGQLQELPLSGTEIDHFVPHRFNFRPPLRAPPLLP